jgi:phosphatidylglycerol:prolipoprotein diacylglycerol transferase
MSFPNGVVPTMQRVHPTPIYEFLAAALIAWLLWKLGAGQARTPIHAPHEKTDARARKVEREIRGRIDGAVGDVRPAGVVFAAYMIYTGIARFLVEFIRINPRSFFGMTNAQTASVASVVLGLALLWHLRNRSGGSRIASV